MSMAKPKPPVNYFCFKCKMVGDHWISNCPIINSKKSRNTIANSANLNSSKKTTHRFCLLLNTNRNVSAPFPLIHENDYTMKKFKTDITEFTLNKFKHKYKLSANKLVLYLENGSNLLTYFSDNDKINDIKQFQTKQELRIYISKGELFIDTKPQPMNTNIDSTQHMVIKQIKKDDMGSLIGKKGRRIHVIRTCEGISQVILFQNKYGHSQSHSRHTRPYSKSEINNMIQIKSEATNNSENDLDHMMDISTMIEKKRIDTEKPFLILIGNKTGLIKAENLINNFIIDKYHADHKDLSSYKSKANQFVELEINENDQKYKNKNKKKKEITDIEQKYKWMSFDLKKENYLSNKTVFLKKWYHLTQLMVIGCIEELDYYTINNSIIKDEVPDTNSFSYPLLYCRGTDDAINAAMSFLKKKAINFHTL
eukprot:346552_1